jgi:hypothetical protein
MVAQMHRRTIAARILKACAVLLGVASILHFVAAPHLSEVLKRTVDPVTYDFLEPIVMFTFQLNAVLLAPLAFSTFYSALGLGRAERWAWRIATANALAVLALPCTLVAIMGFKYFAGAPLFVAGAACVFAAGMLMLLSLAWAATAPAEAPSPHVVG